LRWEGSWRGGLSSERGIGEMKRRGDAQGVDDGA